MQKSSNTDSRSNKNGVIVSNFFKFNLDNNKHFFKYNFQIVPEIPDDSKMRIILWQLGRKQLETYIGPNIFSQTCVYGIKSCQNDINIEVIHQDMIYKLSLEWVRGIEPKSHEGSSLVKRFFTNLIKKKKLINIKNSFYDPNRKIVVKDKDFEIWPGFSTNVNFMGKEILIGVNISHKILRTETALDFLQKLKSKNPNDFRKVIIEEFTGLNVLTRYNGDKNYIIDSVDFDKNLEYEFEIVDKQKNSKKCTIFQYYKERYGITLKNMKQPLLRHKRKDGEIIFLVPELCILTGLNEENIANTNLMKDVAALTRGNATQLIEEIKGFISSILNIKDYKLESEKWGIEIDPNPLQIKLNKLQSGRILLAKDQQSGVRKSFDIETANFDREIQQEMFSQPGLNNWIIFCSSKDKEHAETCILTFKQVMETFNYNLAKPKLIEISNGFNNSEWVRKIEDTIKSESQPIEFILCICPGAKGKAPMYSDIKNLLFTKFNIPSQVILSGTIAKGKNLRSIINKVMIQICAKLGGEPWAINDMPFTSVPTMTVGIDTYSKKGMTHIVLTATHNKSFTKYNCFESQVKNNNEIFEPITDMLVNACRQV